MRSAVRKLIGMNCAFLFALVVVVMCGSDWLWHSAQLGYGAWASDVYLIESGIAIRVRRYEFGWQQRTGATWAMEYPVSRLSPSGHHRDSDRRGFSAFWGERFGSPWSSLGSWHEWSISAPHWFLLGVFGLPGGWWAWRMLGSRRARPVVEAFQTPA